jgi:electron transfer flavoprotein alpha subunit
MILVLVEPEGEGVSILSQEACTFARNLGAVTGLPIHALAVGAAPNGLVPDVAAQGIAVLHRADGEHLATYSAAAWAAAVEQAARATQATVVIAAASPRGNEILAHVAARTAAPMAANCVSAEPDGEGLLVERQVMGGGALEVMRLASTPALFTMAGHAVDPVPVPGGEVDVRAFTPVISEADLVARVRAVEPVTGAGADLATARVVVGAGRGVGSAERFDDLLELAGLLGGSLGVSRVVTSLGWRPHHEQVGQTGSRISPDLYLACGISGAIQHWAGCSTAKTIVAINTDPEAPMVTKAHYAVIADLHEVIPAITAELRRRQA